MVNTDVKKVKTFEDFERECNKLGVKVHKTDDNTDLDDIESLKQCFSSWDEEYQENAAFIMREILLRDREKRRLAEQKKKERDLKRKSKNKRKMIKKSRKKGKK